MDITKMTDVKELKALKADQYDLKGQLEEQYNQTMQNIAQIGVRIAELQKTPEATMAKEPKEKK